jgi:hypothetical protein
METITKGPAFGDEKLLRICTIVKNPRVCNFWTIVVRTMKRKLDVLTQKNLMESFRFQYETV